MRESSLMTLALIGVIIGASGLGFGAYSTMQIQSGTVKGKDGSDGDDGSAGQDGQDAPGELQGQDTGCPDGCPRNRVLHHALR